MIGYLHGTLLDIEEQGCTLLTASGVGYELFLTGPALQRLPEPGGEISFHVQMVQRDDGPELYGFADRREKKTFELLTSVSKLGPRTALSILSVFAPEDIGDIVAREDSRSLSRVQGIGPKSAKRMIWELKEKLGQEPNRAFFQASPQQREQSAPFSDALSGLVNLGYSQEMAAPVLRKVLQEEPDLMTEEAIRRGLQRLSRDSA